MSDQIGKRLLDERRRLGLNQSEMGKAGGVVMRTYHTYENGSRFPDALCLSKLQQAGVDIFYVVTGQRQTALLAPEDQAILDGLNSLKPEQRRIAEEAAEAVINAFRKYNALSERDS